MKCPECGSHDWGFLKVRNGTSIYECHTCGEEFVLDDEV